MKFLVVTIVLVVAFYLRSSAQFLIEQQIPNLVRVGSGSIDWGDYDNDGDLDIVLSGHDSLSKVAYVYKNNGNNNFVKQSTINIVGVYESDVKWGDYNNDGFLDFIIVGNAGSTFATGWKVRLYKNNGNNGFELDSNAAFGTLRGSGVDWGDYDNDGDLDILVVGFGLQGRVTKVFRNDGGGFFTEQVGINIYGISQGSVEWGDYNNDGYLDILLSGDTTSLDYATVIYKNNGNNTFTEQKSISIIGFNFGDAEWGDYDNDGDLDILLTGYDGVNWLSKIYKNNSNNSFSEQTNISILGVSSSSVAWGDYDNDGDLDFVISGDHPQVPNHTGFGATIIYKNTGNDTFEEDTVNIIEDLRNSCIKWGDYDNDGDIDLLLTGWSNSGSPVTKIYKNTTLNMNIGPNSPAGLSYTNVGGGALLVWDKTTDDNTASAGLSYNLRIENSTTGELIKPAQSNQLTGYHRIAKRGAIQDTFYRIDLPVGTKISWAVQAIDKSFIASGFSSTYSTTIEIVNEDDDIISIFPNPIIDELNIKLYLQQRMKVNISLFSVNNHKIDEFSTDLLNSGENEISIFLNKYSLSKGVYFIHFTIGDELFIKKLIKM